MRAILVVTSGRADASPMEPVIKELQVADCEVDHIDLEDEGVVGSARYVEDYIGSWSQLGPDLILLLGDRYETLTTALVATVAQIPIAHIHGGEATFGSFDNQIRDAITKLSHIHFVAAPEYRWRLNKELGEAHERIHVVGAPGLDNLTDLPPREKRTFTFVCTYHPVTATEETIEPLLEALDRFDGYEQIWTGVNNDPGADAVRRSLEGRHTVSFSHRDYLLACREAAAVVGNSSSGIIEAPALHVPTVNVGRRQEGRARGPSVLDAPMEADAIAETIRRALRYDGTFRNPYGGLGASKKIAEILSEIDLEGIRVKSW